MKKKGKTSSAVAAPAEKTEFSLIPPAMLETMYCNLLKNRLIEERMRRGKGQRDDGWVAVKAAAAAVLIDTKPEDLTASADEIPLVRLSRGETAATIVKDRQGIQGEAARSQEAAQALFHALGVAMASKMKRDGRVGVVFWRDASLEQWRDALEIARAHTLPLILVCPAFEVSKDERKKFEGLAPGTELPRILVDGYDAVAVYRVAHESIDRARRGRGATLIECASIRVPGQRGSHGDAVAIMERYLRGKGMLKRGMKQEIEAAFALELKSPTARKKRAGA